MTGAELLAEILQGDLSDFCRLALDGCVLLTAEEAELVADCLMSNSDEALALLTPSGQEQA